MMMLAKWVMNYARKFKKDQRGQAMVEYGLIIALVAVVLIGTIVLLTGGLDGVFGEITTKLNGTIPSPAAEG